MENLIAWFTEIAGHPIKSRVAYDLGIGFLVNTFVYATFYVFGLHVPFWGILPGLPALFILINRQYGIYSMYRMAAPMIKSTVLLFSAITVFAVGYLLNQNSLLFLLLVTFFIGLVAIIPRWFFNLTHKQILTKQVRSLVRENEPILVVGGAGYIGNHVIRELLKRGKPVRAFDTFYYGTQVFDDIKNSGLEIVKGDITDLFTLTKAMSDTQAVIHLAGIVGDPACALDPKLTRHLNLVTTRMLKEQTKAFGIPRFVFASSCSVYGSAEAVMNENSLLNPVSLYAQTKIDAEKELLGDTYDDFHPTVLRFATVFGHSVRMRFDLVVNLFTAQAYNDGLITVTGSEQWRPFVHVKDIARAIAMVIEAPADKVSRQTFNVGDDRLNITIGDLAMLVAKTVGKDKAGRKVRVVIHDNLEDKRNYHVSFKKISQALGFKTETDLALGIKEMAQHFVEGSYLKPYTNEIYSNKEMIKLIKTQFDSPEYQQSHFSLLATNSG